MYYSVIGLLALLTLLMENQDILLNRECAFDKPAWKVYRKFLFAVMVYYITDILWGFIGSFRLPHLLFADTTVYFVAMAVGVLCWAEYTVAYLDERNEFGKALVLIGRLVAGLITLLAVINIFIPVLFTVDADCSYSALPLRFVMLVVQIVLLLVITGGAWSSALRVSSLKGKGTALALFGLLMAAFLFCQLWFPSLPLYSAGYMLGICLLHTLVINHEKEEYRHGMEDAAENAKVKETVVALLDNMPGMVFAKDAETGVYLTCNRSFAQYAHKENPEGVAGLTDAGIFDAETAKHFVEDDRMALSMDKPYIFFEDVPDAAGKPRQLQTTKLKYYNFDGKLCILGICRDVSDMVRIQRTSVMTKEAYEKERSTAIVYTHIAEALARGYSDLFYVNTDTEGYIHYRTSDEGGLKEMGRGWHFFEACQEKVEAHVHPDDLDSVLKALERRNLVAALDRNRSLVITYRLVVKNGVRYVTTKATRMEDDDPTIILGITDVDEEMKHRAAAQRMREEEIAYARLTALAGDFLCIYVVVPETGRYREFSSSEKYGFFGQAREGMDFFAATREAAGSFSHPDDLNRFLSVFTRENVMAEIGQYGIFTVSYRLMLDGKPTYVQLKAAMVEEKEGRRLIVGISDIDSQVLQEEAYAKNLAQARIEANIDALTGVKNRHAYLMAEERLNVQILEHRGPEFAITILDVNDLKTVNDTAGHNAGDELIRGACRIVCETFKHSPVFRVGGDEFAVISQKSDYDEIDELVQMIEAHNKKALQDGGIVIACGMSKYDNDSSVASVFERADQNMYVNKSDLKAGKNG